MKTFIAFTEFFNSFFTWYMVACTIGGWCVLAYVVQKVFKTERSLYLLKTRYPLIENRIEALEAAESKRILKLQNVKTSKNHSAND